MGLQVVDVGGSGGERSGGRFLGVVGRLVHRSHLRISLVDEIAGEEGSRSNLYEGVVSSILEVVAYENADEEDTRNILLGRSTSGRCTSFLKGVVSY